MHREIDNIRYSRDGKIAFNFRGHTILIREPMDVLLVDSGEAAQRWIANGYGFLLATLNPAKEGRWPSGAPGCDLIDFGFLSEAEIDAGIDAEAERSRA